MSSVTPTTDLPSILLQADNLPSLPAVAIEVVRLTREEDSTIDDLADALSRDPALAAKLLKLSNSSLFSQGQEITTLQRAVMQLGLQTVKLMSLSFSLTEALPREDERSAFDYSQFWHRSLVSAVAARNLAQRTEGFEQEAFLCGLLRHIGRMVLARCMQEPYGELLAKSAWPTLEEESEALGFTSADVGYALIKSWELPDMLSTAIGFAGRSSSLPADCEETSRHLINVLEVVSQVESFLRGETHAEALQEMTSATKARFGWEEDTVLEFLAELEPEMKEAAGMLNVELPTGRSHAQLIDEARATIVQVSLSAAVDLNQAQQRSKALESKNRELQTKATTDKLTGLPNRASFDDFMAIHVQARVEGDLPRALGLVMIDVDKFKSFNDTYGHQIGDEVLRMVGAVMKRMTRKGDLAARYGGEEFAVIAPNATPFGLKAVAERLRKAIEQEVLRIDGHELSVTASFGGACLKTLRSERDGEGLIRLADHMLYRAKENGRNRTEIYSGKELPQQ